MRRMITGEQITKINKLNQVDANPTAEPTELLDTVQIGDTVYTLAGGKVESVNGQIGNVVLSAADIKADDQTTIQENIDRIDNAITDVNNALNEEVTTRTTQINGVVTAISALNDAIVAEQQTRSDEIARVEAEVTAVANDLSNHTSDTTIHVTASDKETWSNKVSQEQIADMATKTELNNYATKVELADYVTNDTFNTTVSSINNEIADVRNDIPDITPLATKTELTTELAKKQDVITDLDTIRSGASAGATAVQPAALDAYATTDSVNAAVSDINNNKLDKVTTATSTAQVYYKAANGTNTMRDCNTGAVTNQSIMMRDNTGHCKIVDPVDDSDIANKKYVDNNVSNMITTDTEQTITGRKTFNDVTKFNKPILVYGPGTPGMVEGSAIGISSTGLTRWDLYEGALAGPGFTLTAPRKDGTLAITDDIPNVSNMVTTDTAQTISGHKIFDEGSVDVASSGNNNKAIRIYNSGIGIYDYGTNNQRKAYLTFPRTTGTLALTSDIPDVSNFVTKSEIPEADNIVTTNTEQTISAKKTFTNELRSESYIHIQDNSDGRYLQLYADKIAWKDNLGQIRDNSLPGGSGQLARLDDITYLAVTKTGDQTIQGNFSITRADNSTAFRIYNNQPDQIGIAGWKIVDNNFVRTWYSLPLYDTKTSKIIATTDQIPDTSKFVTTDTGQTITGKKTFQTTVTAPNLTAQGTNESTIYGGTQMVHTFADNTKLNLQFPKKSGNQTIATVGDIKTYYTHCITFKSSNNDTCGTTTIINTSNTAFTADTLKTWLYNNGFRDLPNNTTNGIYMASGAMYYNSTNIPIIGLRSDNTKIIGIAQKSSNGFQQPTITNVVDIVI